jgi:hypothetical protein
VAAAAAFLARAAELTPDPAERGRRAVAAAQAKFDAAESDAALELLATAELAPLDELQRARLERLRAQIAFSRTRGRNAPALLLDAARRLEPLAPAMARETHLEAVAAAMFAGRLGGKPSVREAAEAALAAPAAPQPPRAIDLLLDGLATRFTNGYVAGVPPLRTALDAFRRVKELTARDVRWLWLACRVARETGALSVLPIALPSMFIVHVDALSPADPDGLVAPALQRRDGEATDASGGSDDCDPHALGSSAVSGSLMSIVLGYCSHKAAREHGMGAALGDVSRPARLRQSGEGALPREQCANRCIMALGLIRPPGPGSKDQRPTGAIGAPPPSTSCRARAQSRLARRVADVRSDRRNRGKHFF